IRVPEESMATVVVSGPGGPSQPSTVSAIYVGPSVFAADASGCGQAAVLNVAPDGTLSVNSGANSAAPGDYLAIYGTGLGALSHPLADGAASAVADPINSNFDGVFIGDPADLVYFGGVSSAYNQVSLGVTTGFTETK